MYLVEVEPPAQAQVDALPADAMAAFAELRVVLETAPWSGIPYRKDKPEGGMRVHAFGGAGFAVYLVLERQRRVEVVSVVWAG